MILKTENLMRLFFSVCFVAGLTMAGCSNSDDSKSEDTATEDTATEDTDTGYPAPGAGDLVVTEIMSNPGSVLDDVGEWFEIYNASDDILELKDCELADNAGVHAIAVSLEILPGEYMVFGLNSDTSTNGDIPVDYQYDTLAFSNSGDEITITCGGVIIDEVTFPAATAGSSFSLKEGMEDVNEVESNWYIANNVLLPSGDTGTPGMANTDQLFSPVAGDLVITEICSNPAAVGDSVGEWFELFNTTNMHLSLDGCTLRDDGADEVLINGLVIAPGDYVVLGVNDNILTNGNVEVDYAYTYQDFSLSNSSDEVIIECNDIIDEVYYDDGVTFPAESGKSMMVVHGSTDAISNDVGSNWCASPNQWLGSTGDYGSPGGFNGLCN